jgi:23S rRNA (cytidine2498-2'-O)-methyltransferase
MIAILLLTRMGFEPDLQVETTAWLQRKGVHAELEPAGSGALLLRGTPGQIQAIWERWRDWRTELVFAREMIGVLSELRDLPRGARIEAILASWHEHQEPINAVCVYAPDAESTRPLLPMTTSLQNSLQSKITLDDAAYQQQLHVVFLESERALLGISHLKKSAPVPGGIPRLKFPPAAPSRSTLKLDEAFLTLLDGSERLRWLERGMKAVDLGASPGGWSYQLVRRGIQVIAIDNGAMDGVLMRSGMVQHERVDGFKYKPKRPVDWMVCDMVEQPLKVAQLAAHWINDKRCRFAMVNLKLPMKKRFAELETCFAALADSLGDSMVLRCKQLYHDREEVTMFLTKSEYLTAAAAVKRVRE